MAGLEALAGGPSDTLSALPTVFDPETLIKKGMCEVAKGRNVQTHSLYYEIHGDPHATEHVVLIMGLVNSCFGWQYQVEHLARQPNTAVLVFDNRGVGNSDLATGVYKTSEMAFDTIELLDHVGWNKPRSVHVCGVSMGGMIGQHVVLLAPQRVASLILLSSKTNEGIDLPPFSGLRQAVVMFSMGRLLGDAWRVNTMVNILFPTEWVDVPFPNPEPGSGQEGKTRREWIEKDFLKRYKFTREQPVQGAFAQLAAVLTHKISAAQAKDIARLAPRVVIIAGDQDQLINYKRSEDMHRQMVGSELHIIKGGGHALPYQMPEELNLLLDNAIRDGRKACQVREGAKL